MKLRGTYLGVLTACMTLAFACGGDKESNKTVPAANGGSAGASQSHSAGAPDAGADDGHGTLGGSGGKPGTSTGGSAGTAGRSEAAAGSSEQGGDAGAGGEGDEAGFVSQPSGVELVLDAQALQQGFTLVSSNLTQSPSGSMYYKEWFAEVHNGTGQTQCFIQVSGDFQGASSNSLVKFDSYAQGRAFDGGSSVPLTCAAPNETVPLWTNALDAISVPMASVKRLSVKISGTARPTAVLHPSTPVLGALTQTKDPLLMWWNVSGSARAVADVYNVKVEFWGKSGGVIVGKTDAFHLDDFLSGQSWDFKTDAGIEAQTLDGVKAYVDFIDGLESTLRVIYDEETAALMKLRDAAQASRQAADERKARAQK